MAKIAINIATGSLQQDEMIVGIDLGTTNSLVSIIHPETGKPVALKEAGIAHDAKANALVPSLIHFGTNGAVTVGDAAREYLISDPARTVFSSKRLMGKNYEDLKTKAASFSYRIIDDADKMVKVQVDEQFYSPIDLAAYILKELKTKAEHILKTPVTKAVITVPAYFNDSQRQATRDAGKLAGLDVLRIINEPTAASLAYGFGLDKSQSKTIAVYDLGGGTFDISILNIANGIFEVLATNGDTYLGGDDLDAAIVEHWMGKNNIPGDELETKQRLRLYAETAKRSLSEKALYEIEFEGISLQLSREELDALTTPLLDKTLACCRNALKDAGLEKSAIDEVIMVGGSTRMPFIKDSISDFFGRKVNDSVNPDEVVALGAAIQADILAGNTRDLLLLDVTPLSLGIETMGGLMDVLLPRNSKIPTRTSRQYTTQKDGQSGIRISVYQGERDLVKDNRLLAEFVFSGIPAMPAGMPKVELSFLINADGILVVRAKELRSGVEQTIEVRSQSGLSDETVEQMLLDSMKNAKADVEARALAEASTEAAQLLETTENFIQKNIQSLTAVELKETSEAMQALQLSIDMGDKNLIQAKTVILNDISRPYAERIMDGAISKALAGKKV